MIENNILFISGSIAEKELPKPVRTALDVIISKHYRLMIGDARGIDQLVQKYLVHMKYYEVLVCHISNLRIIESNKFSTKKIDCDLSTNDQRKLQSCKDKYMTKESDASFIIWNGKSNGSYNNIIRAIKTGKKVQVFLDDRFLNLDEIIESNIRTIYEQRHRYSLTEYLEKLKEDGNSQIKTTKQMKKVLIERCVLIEGDSVNSKYKDDIEVTLNRGVEVLKYKKSLLDEYFATSSNTYVQDSLL